TAISGPVRRSPPPAPAIPRLAAASSSLRQVINLLPYIVPTLFTSAVPPSAAERVRRSSLVSIALARWIQQNQPGTIDAAAKVTLYATDLELALPLMRTNMA
ncbi:hypothetical protein CF336_g5185, partial [Tilletia laevis]